jgi:hypothetical protein
MFLLLFFGERAPPSCLDLQKSGVVTSTCRRKSVPHQVWEFESLVARILEPPDQIDRSGLTPPDTANMSIEAATAPSPTSPALR